MLWFKTALASHNSGEHIHAQRLLLARLCFHCIIPLSAPRIIKPKMTMQRVALFRELQLQEVHYSSLKERILRR